METKYASNYLFEDVSFIKNKTFLLNFQASTKNELYFYSTLFSKKKLIKIKIKQKW